MGQRSSSCSDRSNCRSPQASSICCWAKANGFSRLNYVTPAITLEKTTIVAKPFLSGESLVALLGSKHDFSKGAHGELIERRAELVEWENGINDGPSVGGIEALHDFRPDGLSLWALVVGHEHSAYAGALEKQFG